MSGKVRFPFSTAASIKFNPANIYLGRTSLFGIFASLAVVVFWIAIFYLAVQFVWQKGLRIYSAEGR